jgi:ATPase subunit of ABC transporter with duplicated ATPase domains
MVNPEQKMSTMSLSNSIEPDPAGIVSVDIKNVRKVFDGKKVAVDNMSLKMYDGEIFVLLGHNGMPII